MLSQSGDLLEDLESTSEEQSGRTRRYLVGYDSLDTLDERIPGSGRIVRTAALDTLGRTAVVELPESTVPEMVSATGIEYVLDLDHL
jgi:hypothetical protein